MCSASLVFHEKPIEGTATSNAPIVSRMQAAGVTADSGLETGSCTLSTCWSLIAGISA